ncbi:family 43 glycosylhydrolase [Paenibacillus polymyxa]|uniref:family 43 glycosylhydrolase n=2 Tax=Paenibacillus polymyxa TaxID=1406 RepID=UPI0023F906F2|nr:family 43 glycosylhydrolase [Paenibacillus polymyxa]MEE4563965.1 family 43 glycosylhydrolase [Paenibacillus polymyxa]
MSNSIRPGQVWLDTKGKRIQAHGSSVMYVDGVYYWYGENKENTIPGSGVWHNGVNCYSSEDLINWKFEKTILKAPSDVNNPLHPSRIMDRPHIIYNKKNEEFVMWMKLAGTDENPRDWNYQYMGIATSKSINEEFKLIDTIVPLDMSSGDFDLFVDDNDQAYIIFGKVHTEIVIADLTDDYKNLTGKYSTHLHFSSPPLAREAPAIFKRENEYFMFTSGTTGYYPNQTLSAKADNMHGPWYIIGDPCIEDTEKNTFNSQISSVFKVPNQDLFIAIGDRWVVDLTRKKEKSSWNINTSESDYVWLPVEFRDNIPVIQWKSEWNPNNF